MAVCGDGLRGIVAGSAWAVFACLFVGIRFMRMSRMFFGGLAGICDCAVELLSYGRGKMSLHTCRLFAVCRFASALHAPELNERRPLGACPRPIYSHRRGTTNKHRQRLVGCLAQRDANTELTIHKLILIRV